MKRNYNFLVSWKGRLGNNLIALANVIHYSEIKGQRLRYRKHWMLPQREFNFGNNFKNLRVFYGSQAYPLEKEFKNFHLHRYKVFQDFIYPLLIDDSEIDFPYITNIEPEPGPGPEPEPEPELINVPEEPIKIVDKRLDGMMLGLIKPREDPRKKSKKKQKQFLIYIRSGDIIKDSRISVHPTYVQSPNSYIQHVLEKEQPEKIIVLYEDDRNPMVPFLMDNYSSIICPKRSGFKPLREVITMMLNSEVLVQTGLTTLLSTISLCSHKLEKIYIPKYKATEQSSLKTAFTIMSNKYNPSVDVRYIEHKNYIKAGEWRGKLDQSLRF